MYIFICITAHVICYYFESNSYHKVLLCLAGSDSLSTGAVATITFTVTFIITLTATAIVTFIVTYICVKRKFESAFNHNNQSPQEKVIYEQVIPTSQAISKNDVKLQPNPAYGTSHKVIMDTNPTYETC